MHPQHLTHRELSDRRSGVTVTSVAVSATASATATSSQAENTCGNIRDWSEPGATFM